MELKLPKRLKGAGQKKPQKGKAFRASSGAKYVLFLGDEGAILVYIKGSIVQSRQFIPDANQESLQEFRQTLSKDPAAPVTLVVDNMDQSYVQQTLPPVSSFSVNRLIKRRLERDFGTNDIKGAILLGREKSGRKDWNFLMVALEKSPQIKLWLDFIQGLPHRFIGINLLSVEAEILVKHLARSLGHAVQGKDDEWQFFVSHNKVGGFRQVVLKNGRIIFTRLAQPVGESTSEVIAGSIEQEMLSTIEYMKRLSFAPQSKLSIYIIASSGIKSSIDPEKFNATEFHIFTPYEVAQLLGIEGAAQPTDQFGDVILASVIGCSRKRILVLAPPQTKLIDQYYQFVLYQRVAAVLAIFAIFCTAVVIGRDIYALMQDNDALQSERESQQRALVALRDRIKEAHIDIDKASDLLDMYQQLQAEKLSPLPLIKKLEPIVNSPVWVKSVDWALTTDTKPIRRFSGLALAPEMENGEGAPPKVPDVQMITNIMLEFPQQAADPKIFKVVSKKILSDFRSWFKGYDVRYASIPDEVTETDKMEIRSSSVPKEDLAPKSLDVQLSIRGDLSALQSETPPPAAPKPDAAPPASAGGAP